MFPTIAAAVTALLAIPTCGLSWFRHTIETSFGVGVKVPETNEKALKEVVSDKGLVVGVTSLKAQEIGVNILRKGGTAMDAALATAMAQIVLWAGSTVSFAGRMDLLYYEAAKGKVHHLDGSYNTVLAEDKYRGVPRLKQIANLKQLSGAALIPKEGHYNGRTVPVPGFMRSLETGHQRFGKLPIADIFEPAIQLCEEGFEIDKTLAYLLQFREKVLSHDLETKAHFVTSVDGQSRFFKEGDTFRQPALAETLRNVVRDGADYMYKGPWGEKMVSKVQAIGGRMTMEDMSNYEAMWRDPVRGSFDDYKLYACGLPNVAGTDVIEAMHLLEASDLRTLGRYTDSPQSFYWLSHITRNGCNKHLYLKGNESEVESFMAKRLTKDHARELWSKLEKDGGWWRNVETYPNHSDAVVAVDMEGNIAALTHTINTLAFGETGLVIDGVSIPDSLIHQWEMARLIKPGDRLPAEPSPIIVTQHNRGFGGFSGINGAVHQQMVNILFNILAHDTPLQTALNQPALGVQFFVPKIGPFKLPSWILPSIQVVSSGGLGPSIVEEVQRMGLKLGYNDVALSGDVCGVTVEQTGAIHGGACPHFDGRAVGV